MQVTELKSEGLKKEFKIVVDSARIQEQMEVELRAAGERVKIPGFRPGFIPMKVLQQRYGKAVQADVLKQVINQATTDVINERKLRPALTPQVNIEDYKEGGELVFSMTFESFPEMPDIDYGKITLDRKVYEIKEADIDEAIARIAERSPKLNRAKEGTKAASGHVVNIDFVGRVGGVEFSGGSATGFQLELGSGQFIEGFEDQVIGAGEGDKVTVTVTFPKDYPSPDIAGKEAEFAVTVHEVHEKETPEIDENFVKARGFADIRAFREAVRGQMVKEYDQVVRNHLKKELFDQLDAQYKMDLPEGMVDMEFNAIWKRLQQAKSEGDASVAGKKDEELREEYMQIARRRVKLGLLLAEVGTRNHIQITREELTRAIMQQASMYPGQENKVMDFYRKHPERMDDLRGPILEEKAVDYVLSQIAFKDHPVTLDELASSEGDMDSEEPQKKPEKEAKSSKTAKAEPEEKPRKKDESQKKSSAKKKAAK